MIRLPVLSPGAASFAELEAREAALLADLGPPPGRRLSANAKTSVSFDFPIGQTCSARTAICEATCYAKRSGTPAMWPKSLRKRLHNWSWVRSTPTEDVVARLLREFRQAQRVFWRRGSRLNHLRFCGTGDIFPEVIPVIDQLAAAAPEVAIWVVTRQFGLAAKLAPAPNLFLQLSIDASTPALELGRARRLVRTNPRAYLSFLRVAANDDVRGAAIVFNEKRTEGLPYRSKTDCPVDAGALPLGNVKGQGGTACASCRKCFDERTLARQRGEMPAMEDMR